MKEGGPKHAGGHKIFGKKDREGHNIFDDQNVRSYKLMIDLFCPKKTDSNTILACWKVVGCVGGRGVIKFLLPKQGVAILLMLTFCKFGTPIPKKILAP